MIPQRQRPLNVLFVPTANSGIMWWRIQSWVEAAWKTGAANFQNPLWFKDLNDIQPWQGKLTDGPKYDPFFIREFVPMIETGCVNADAVVFQYAHEEGAIELFDAIKTKFPHLPVLVEIDDNILSVPYYNDASVTYDPRSDVRQRTLQQIRAADGVITTTPHLKEVYGEYNSNVWVVENSVDVKAWDRLKRRSRPGIRIGWAGGNGREGDIAIIENAIKNVCRKHKDVKFVFVGGPAKTGLPDFLAGNPQVEHKAVWEPILKYPKLLADLDFDIGISPLVDSAFNRGKSNLKWLENSALGIPTVASNVGHYAETLRNGVDALLADDENGFELALDVLISDRRRRRQIGMSANARLRQDFSLEKNIHKYVAVLKEAIQLKADGFKPFEVVEAA